MPRIVSSSISPRCKEEQIVNHINEEENFDTINIEEKHLSLS